MENAKRKQFTSCSKLSTESAKRKFAEKQNDKKTAASPFKEVLSFELGTVQDGKKMFALQVTKENNKFANIRIYKNDVPTAEGLFVAMYLFEKILENIKTKTTSIEHGGSRFVIIKYSISYKSSMVTPTSSADSVKAIMKDDDIDVIDSMEEKIGVLVEKYNELQNEEKKAIITGCETDEL